MFLHSSKKNAKIMDVKKRKIFEYEIATTKLYFIAKYDSPINSDDDD